MITVKNISTGEIKSDRYICVTNNIMHTYFKAAKPSDRFFSARPEIVKTSEIFKDEKHNTECMVVKLAEGFELVANEKPQPKPKEAKPKTTNPQPTNNKKPAKVETTNSETEQPKPQLKASRVEDDALELAKLLQRLKGGNVTIDANQVRTIIADELAKLAKVKGAKVVKLAKKTASENEHHCADFDEICDYVSDGQPVYLYGAAGCGKSYTAQQIANALSLDFYTQSQVLFAHDVKGYGDANGNFQETPFFKAFTKGGLFFIDEMDASAPEALVVLNTAIANRMYDFPVVGNVKAHEDFRIIAAGNTALTGADTEYTARAVQDASTINRFSFFEMSYDKEIELPVMANNDVELYNFVCDLRNAIKETRISLCVSYRQTATLASEKAIKYGRDKALMRNVFGGRETDEIRILHEALTDKSNVWAKAMKSLIK